MSEKETEVEVERSGILQNKLPAPIHPIELESQTEKKVRYRSIRIGQVALLIFSIGFSIVLTGVYPYMTQLSPGLDERSLLSRYGWVVAANPLGQTIAAPLFGLLYQKTGSARMVGVITSLVYIGGNILYSILSVFPQDYRYPLLLLSRFTVGFCAGNIATIRSYIVDATFLSERTTELAMISSTQALGFLIGPGFQSALTPLECANPTSETYIAFDMYTSTGWVSAFLGVLSLILFLTIFKEVNVSSKERQYAKDCKLARGEINTADNTNDDELPKPDLIAAMICLLTFFTYIFNFVLVETLGTPLCMDHFGWTEEKTVLYFGILISVVGLMAVFLFASVGPLCKRFDERKILLIAGILIMFLGRIALFPIPGLKDIPTRNASIATSIDNENLSLNPLVISYQDENEVHIDSFTSYERFLLSSSNKILGNEACTNTTKREPGCELEWCKDQSALTIWQLFGAIVLGTIGYPYAVAITQSIFSKIIGPRPQGLWMGLLSAFGSFSRILGPLFVSYIYTNFGTYWTMGSMAATLIISFVVTLLAYNRLVPMNIDASMTSNTNPETEEAHL